MIMLGGWELGVPAAFYPEEMMCFFVSLVFFTRGDFRWKFYRWSPNLIARSLVLVAWLPCSF